MSPKRWRLNTLSPHRKIPTTDRDKKVIMAEPTTKGETEYAPHNLEPAKELDHLIKSRAPDTKIDFSEVMRHKTNYLTPAEVDKMLNYLYEQGRVRDYMLMLTLWRTGRRITEIVGDRPYTRKKGLRPIDLHPDGLIEFDILKKNPIKVRTKSGVKRDPDSVYRARVKKEPKRLLMPVDDEYMVLLRSYIESEGIALYDRVFPMVRQTAWKIVSRTAEACGIARSHGKIHPHTFRHSIVINMLKSNPHDPSILIKAQRLLAHANLEITQGYAQFTPEDIREVLNEIF